MVYSNNFNKNVYSFIRTNLLNKFYPKEARAAVPLFMKKSESNAFSSNEIINDGRSLG